MHLRCWSAYYLYLDKNSPSVNVPKLFGYIPKFLRDIPKLFKDVPKPFKDVMKLRVIP